MTFGLNRSFASKLIVGGLIGLSLAGCQLQPTRTSERFDGLSIDDSTVVLDTRSRFDYGLSRIANSKPFSWQSLVESTDTAEELRDPQIAARRLSLLGLSPGQKILIVGYGKKGGGDEGRLAWSLLRLGFKRVKVGAYDLFKNSVTVRPTPENENAARWTAVIRADIEINPRDFKDKLEQIAKRSSAARVEKGDQTPKASSFSELKIVGVGHEEGSNSHLSKSMRVLQLDWREFYGDDGRPNAKVMGKLTQLGVERTDEVIFISQRGVFSGAATYAALELGYSHSKNVAGGWQQVDKSKP